MKQDLDRVLARGRSETGGLDSVILAKENARVMLTINIDVNDRLIDEQMGAIKKNRHKSHHTKTSCYLHQL